jgi:hypothetical protein
MYVVKVEKVVPVFKNAWFSAIHVSQKVGRWVIDFDAPPGPTMLAKTAPVHSLLLPFCQLASRGAEDHIEKIARASRSHGFAVVELDDNNVPTRFYFMPCNRMKLTPTTGGHMSPLYGGSKGNEAVKPGVFVGLVARWLEQLERQVFASVTKLSRQEADTADTSNRRGTRTWCGIGRRTCPSEILVRCRLRHGTQQNLVE